jgi:transcriptional repressor NrdR
VRCPACGNVDDKVVDSRLAEEGASIRRRRECLQCGRRFTSYERIEELPLLIVKRSGEREPFSRQKVAAGVKAAAKGRPLTAEQVDQLAADVEEEVRLVGAEVTSEEVGIAVLDRLRPLDEVGYLRFASVYKGFEDAADFQREVTLLRKSTEPKRRQPF